MLKVPDVGEPLLLGLLRTALNAEGLVVRLFRNDKTPADGDVVGDYTEANFDGYAADDLENFDTPASDGNGRSRVEADAVVFEKSAGATSNDIYGYYITNSAGTELWWAERDPNAPTALATEGSKLTVTPRLTLRSEA